MKKFMVALVAVTLIVGFVLPGLTDSLKTSYYPAWIDHWENAGVLVAAFDDVGIYESYGLNVTDHPGGPALNPIERMLNDRNISFCTSYSWLALIAYIDQGIEELRVVSTDFQDPALHLVTWFPIENKEDLFGKTIECWQGYEYPLLAYLGKDHNKMNLRSQGASMEPFLLKQVDGAHAMIYNELLTVLHEYNIEDLDAYYAMEDKPFYVYKYGELDPELAWGENSLITTSETISQHPATVQSFVTATYEGWTWAMTHDPDDVVDIMLTYNDSLDRAHEIAGGERINELMIDENTRQYGLGHIDVSTWMAMGRRLYKTGVLSRMPTVEDILTLYHPVASGVFPPE